MKKTFLLKTMLLLCALIAGVSGSWGQESTVLFHETFGDNSGSARAWDDSYSVKSGVYAVYSGITGYTVTNAKQSKNTVGSTKSGLTQTSQGTDASIIIGPLNVADYSSLVLTYQWKAASIKGTYSTSAYYATSATGSYTELTGTGTGATTFVERSYDLPAAAQISTLYIKIVWNTSNTQAVIDEVDLAGVGGGTTPSLEDNDLALTDAPVALSFDLYNNSAAQTISYTTSSTGAVTVSASDYVTTTVDATNKTITVTPIAVTPSEQTITVSQAADDTYAAGSATFTVSITGMHTVTFSVNGVTTTKDVNEGDAIDFPEDIDDISGKAFVGWVTAAIDGTTDEAPEFVTSATMGTEEVTYYAVFANVTKGDHEDVADKITADNLTATSTNYTDFSGVSITSAAKYAGNSAKNSSGYIQMRSANSNSGIVSTTSGGKLKSVKITVGSGSNTIDVYGSNTAYTAASDLYATGSSANQGTKIGSVTSTGTITVSGNYEYVGIRSNSGAIYLSSIEITWETGTPDTYSSYCTTIPENVTATIASSGYTTYCSPYDLSFEGVENLEAAYVVTTSTSSSAKLTKVTAVPAGTGVILKGTTGAVSIPVAEYTGETISNILVGTLEATPVTAGTVYVVSGGKFMLFAGTEIPANKAYLPASALTGGAPSLSFDFGGETTGINSVERGAWSVEGCYTLDGRRVAEPTKGLYIVNGKKVVIK